MFQIEYEMIGEKEKEYKEKKTSIKINIIFFFIVYFHEMTSIFIPIEKTLL